MCWGKYNIISKDYDCFLEYESVKDNSIIYNAHLAIKIIQAKLMNN